MARVRDMRNIKKVEDTVDEKNTEVVVQDEFDYEKLSQRIFDRLCEFHKKYDNDEIHDFPTIIESNNDNVNDFTIDKDYVYFLESQVAQLQYKLHLLENGE